MFVYGTASIKRIKGMSSRINVNQKKNYNYIVEDLELFSIENNISDALANK